MKIKKCPEKRNGVPCGYEVKNAVDPLACPHCNKYFRGVAPGIKVEVHEKDFEALGFNV